MAQLHCIVDLCLSEPGLLVPGGENLDSHTLPHPCAPPHFTISAFTWIGKDRVNQGYRKREKENKK